MTSDHSPTHPGRPSRRPDRLRAVLVTGLAGGLVTALLAGCQDGGPAAPAPSGASGPSATRALPSGSAMPQARLGRPRVLVRDLELPWAVAFLPGEGSALVTERRTARVLRVTMSGRVRPVGTVPGVSPIGEGGLLGLAASPGFDTDRTVYVYYTAAEDNRVVRFRYEPSGRLTGGRPVVTGIPRSAVHDGGRIAFGPDGMLYVSTGEAGDPPRAQDRDDLGGKILRVTPQGRPAPGNPFQDDGGARALVWSYGHRNVQGLAWTPDGRLFASEFGASRFDELNLIEPGRNYGWPEVEGAGGPRRFAQPAVTWPTTQASPSGLAYAGGSLWVCALRGERLWRIPLAAAGGTGSDALGRPEPLLRGEFGRLRACVADPEGTALWITTSNRDNRGEVRPGDDKILRIPLT